MDRFTLTALDRTLAGWDAKSKVTNVLGTEDILGKAGREPHSIPTPIHKLYHRAGIVLQPHRSVGSVACYDKVEDVVRLPRNTSVFCRPEDLWLIMCHEAIHWTGHPYRLNRLHGVNKGPYGYTPEYCLEEATAQIGGLLLLDVFRLATDRNIELTQSYAFEFIRYLSPDPEDRQQGLDLAIKQAKRAASYLLRKGRYHAKAYRIYRENGLGENNGHTDAPGDFFSELGTGEICATLVRYSGIYL